MPEQDTQAKIARKVKFAIQVLSEAAELLDAQERPVQRRAPRYPRRNAGARVHPDAFQREAE